MSLTLIIWLALFAGLTVLAFARPAWGVAVYMLSVFACPPFWWWGDAIAPYRWNFVSGCILLGAVVVNGWKTRSEHSREIGRVKWLALAMLGNAVLVHVALADDWSVSGTALEFMAKFVLLFFLITASVRNQTDLRIIVWSILLGAAYVGYEITVNDRGHFKSGRLEGVGLPNASLSNELASLMVTIVPLIAPLFLSGRLWEKMLVLLVAPLIVNVVLLCDSRGAFLACLTAAAIFVIAAPHRVRAKCIKVVALGAVAVWLLLGDPRILERFWTTFAAEQERDGSATSRLEYWAAGLRMVADYPLGTGGDGFHDVHGPKYIQEVNGDDFVSRSIHNGYLNTACDWGVQGLALTAAFAGSAVILAWRVSRISAKSGHTFNALLGIAIVAGMAGFLITCVFGDFLDNEWGYWMIACGLAYAEISQGKVITTNCRAGSTVAPMVPRSMLGPASMGRREAVSAPVVVGARSRR